VWSATFAPARLLLSNLATSASPLMEDPMTRFDESDPFGGETLAVRPPNPGVAAVLSVLLPGLGQLYSGRFAAAVGWFLATAFAYWAILLPGFAVHAFCVWSAYQSARSWRGY